MKRRDEDKISFKGKIDKRSGGIYRIVDGVLIPGKARYVFIHNLYFYLTTLKIYADGMIDCWDLVTFEEFKEKIKSGWVVINIPDNADISVSQLSNFKINNPQNQIEEAELIKEVQDIINELNEKPTTSEICREAFEDYRKNPTQSNKNKLKDAYEAIPEHNRIYVLGDMDNKDRPIKDIIYDS